MLHIVGGTYIEQCFEPTYSSDFFGSGGRAAAAVSKLSESVVLSTYTSDAQRPNLESLATTFGFQIDTAIAIPATIKFQYAHGLASPRILPSLVQITQATMLQIDSPVVLRFGMMEGDAIIRAGRAIYDPQSAFHPQPFSANGSIADHLAIVANFREACALSGETELASIGATLLTKSSAEVVIVKQGVRGTTVFCGGKAEIIPPFKTDQVWAIGSGDVFSAVFAHYWGELGMNALEATRNAAKATALYCNTRSLPLSQEAIDASEFPPLVWKTATQNDIGSIEIYLASPFFTMSQRWLVNEARNGLRGEGLAVFSPWHDVGHGMASDVVPQDVEALHRCAVVYAVIDGFDPGTIFEVGYARARQKPVIAFVQNESAANLKMLEGTDCIIVDDFVTSIYKTAWAALEA